MHRRRAWTTAAGASVATVLLAACGTGTAPASDAAERAAGVSTPTSRPPVAKVTPRTNPTLTDGPTSEFDFYNAANAGKVGGKRPAALAVGDLDGDRVPETIVTAEGSDAVVVLRSSEPLDYLHTYATIRSFPSGGRGPMSVAVAELDGDSAPDVVVANAGSDEIAVLAGTGTGKLRAPVTFGSGGRKPVALAVADLDGDKHADAVVANAETGDVAVLLGEGHGRFGAAKAFQTGGTPAALVLADVDGDGTVDAVVADSASSEVVLLRGQGTGGFDPAERFDAGVRHPRWLSTADLDGDGLGDIAVGSPETVGVGVLRGQADGFGRATLVERPHVGDKTAVDAAGVVLGRLDADALPDLAVADENGALWVFRGTAQGLEPVGYERTLDVRNGAIVLGDVNADGGLDVVTAGKTDVGVTLSYGQPGCAGPPPGRSIVGTEDADLLVGTKGRDFIFGLGGDDVIRGGGGRYDLLCGGPGDDVIHGGPGEEGLWGGPGNDKLYGYADDNGLYGEDGDDLLVAAGSQNRMEGGPGDDVLRSTGDGEGRLVGGPGEDDITAGKQDTVFPDETPPGYGED